MVIVDPETGVLGNAVGRELNRPATIEEAQAYARQIAAELVTETHADGSQSLIHDDRLADYAVIRITPGGELNFQCVHGDAAAHGALCAPRPTDSFLEVE